MAEFSRKVPNGSFCSEIRTEDKEYKFRRKEACVRTDAMAEFKDPFEQWLNLSVRVSLLG